ncbi:MAG: methyltransferase domain-containing protein [Thaumarchaeota archaeon]|nr:methyltransferase domain-containing protein [Nitrososphaerota archaeon]
MHQSSLEYLRCVNCISKLELEPYKESNEVDEGFLFCTNCRMRYPIISKIPIMWPNFSSYLSNRARLGGYLMLQSKNPGLKSFVKKSLKEINKNTTDVTKVEERWVQTYKNSLKSKFYSHMRERIRKLPRCDAVLEHGCSIGYIAKELAKRNDLAFGIDQSFYAISEAKKNNSRNLDFFVANSLAPPFGKRKFGLIVAQNKLDPKLLRSEIERCGFKLINDTKKPRFIPWKLNINSRLSLHYKVDLVIARN